MKTLHLVIIVILTMVGISSTEIASATSGNLTSNYQPPYPNTKNLTMYNPLLFPALQAPSPDLLKTLPPLKQFKSGISPKDVRCILGFELILKTENNSPACVELETAQKFVDRGWAKMIIPNALNSGIIVTIPVNSSISTSGLMFSPSTVRVVIGINNTVEWINMDGVLNDITGVLNDITGDTGFFKTSLVPHGHAWEYLFDKTGTYQYHSSSHPWIKGTVIVVENNTSSQQISNSTRPNPFGIVGLMYYYGGGPCGVGVCPLNTFNLKMNSNHTAYLLGYNICDGNSCIVRNDLSILLPLNVIGTPDYKFIALPENPQWKHEDVFHIQVEVSSIPDNKTAIWTDLGNSTVIH